MFKEQSADELAQDLINQYWIDFENGKTWNYYRWSPKYVASDTWATKEDFLSYAKQCVDSKTNILSALEILIQEEYDDYIALATTVVEDWYKHSRHDAYYYYDILAYFPEDNPIRREYLGTDNVTELLEPGPDIQWNSDERNALLAVGDKVLCQHLAEIVSNIFSANTVDDELAENCAMPVLVGMGSLASQYVDSQILEKAKAFCREYLEKDKEVVLAELDGKIFTFDDEDSERSLWVRDSIASWSWCLGWDDVLLELKKMDWYGLSLFSESWSDYENTELLTWSLLDNNALLERRAVDVMTTHPYHPLDGAIAWRRLKERKNLSKSKL